MRRGIIRDVSVMNRPQRYKPTRTKRTKEKVSVIKFWKLERKHVHGN